MRVLDILEDLRSASNRSPKNKTQPTTHKRLNGVFEWVAGGLCTLIATTYALGLSESRIAAQPLTDAALLTAETTDTGATATRQGPQLSDGVYLYGQSATPEEIGQAYMVFEVRGDRLLGAFYMPHSSFDCFYGNIEDRQLALTIIDSYEQSEYAYAMPIEAQPVAGANDSGVGEFGLEGMSRLKQLSDNDRRILGVCQQNYQQKVWGE
jgi:hypothetical protein